MGLGLFSVLTLKALHLRKPPGPGRTEMVGRPRWGAHRVWDGYFDGPWRPTHLPWGFKVV